jgi:hypothetical protein
VAVVVTKSRIRSTCAGRVTRARHPAVHVCHQVSHTRPNKILKNYYLVKNFKRRKNGGKKKQRKNKKSSPSSNLLLFVFVCVCSGLFVCVVRRHVDRLIVSAAAGCCVWSTGPPIACPLETCRDFLSRCQRFCPGAAGIDYWPPPPPPPKKNIKHTHKITKNEKKENIFLILSFFSPFPCAYLFLL